MIFIIRFFSIAVIVENSVSCTYIVTQKEWRFIRQITLFVLNFYPKPTYVIVAFENLLQSVTSESKPTRGLYDCNPSTVFFFFFYECFQNIWRNFNKYFLLSQYSFFFFFIHAIFSRVNYFWRWLESCATLQAISRMRKTAV